MLSFESTVRPPTSPMIQLLGSGFGHPGSGTKLGAVPPGAGFGGVRSSTRWSACDLDSASIPPLPLADADAGCSGAEHATLISRSVLPATVAIHLLVPLRMCVSFCPMPQFSTDGMRPY